MRIPTAVPVLVPAALLALTVSGCGSQGSNDSSSSATTTVTATATVTRTATTSASASSQPSSSATPPCRTADVRFRLVGGEGAAGSTYYTLRMTNTSTAACRTSGFGGVSLVSQANGEPIGAPADRTKKNQAKQVVLAPGHHANATLRVVEAGNYSSTKCQPQQAAGFRVYPPDETSSAFVKHPTPACASGGVHLLSLTPYAG